jgi:hypothetical protein
MDMWADGLIVGGFVLGLAGIEYLYLRTTHRHGKGRLDVRPSAGEPSEESSPFIPARRAGDRRRGA